MPLLVRAFFLDLKAGKHEGGEKGLSRLNLIEGVLSMEKREYPVQFFGFRVIFIPKEEKR